MCCLTQSIFAGIPKSWQRKGSITMGCVCLSVYLSACLSDCLTLKCSPPRMLYASIQISWQWKWLRNIGMSVSASLPDVHPALTCGSLHICTLYKFVLLWCAEHRWPGSAGSWPWPLWQRLHQDMQGDSFFFCFFSLKSFSYSACRFEVSSDFRVCNFQDHFHVFKIPDWLFLRQWFIHLYWLWSCASWLVEWVASYSYYYFFVLGSALYMCHMGLLTGSVTKWLWCGMSRWVQMPSSRWHCRWRTWRMQGSWPWPTRRPWHVSTCMAVPRPCDRSPAKPPLLLSKTQIQNSKYLLSVAIITTKWRGKKSLTPALPQKGTLNNLVNVEDSSSLVVLLFVLKGFLYSV